MRRGEIWTVAGGGAYTGKPRPAVIVQDDVFEAMASVAVCGFTSHLIDAPLFRLAVHPTELNGLQTISHLMVDKITTVARTRLGAPVGRLSDPDILRLNQALALFLGLAAGTRNA